MKKIIIIINLLLLYNSLALARPEYAVRNNITNCTACHASPTGGGIRNSYGKIFGNRNFASPKHSLTGLYQMDLRAIAIVPEKSKESRNGLGLMSAVAAAHIPVMGKPESEGSSVVLAYNLGSFAPGIREAYVRYQKSGELVKNIIVGRFNAPFGLLTDEHRTYSRIQNKTTLNDFHMGVLVSGQLFNPLHYDVAIVNGFQTTSSEQGGNFSTGPTSGAYSNFRWGPSFLPLQLGLSGSYHSRHSGESDPYSYAVYSAISVHRLTRGYLPMELLIEFQRAKHWNDSSINPDFGRRIILPSNSSIQDQLIDTESESWYSQLSLDLSLRFSLLYKYDYLRLNREFSGDAYERHGVGFRYWTDSNMNIQFRAEYAEVGLQGLDELTPAKQDAYWLLGHYWF